MQLESLGHESWIIKTSHGAALIDPLLNREFGNSPRYLFEKLSHRELDVKELSEVRAVFLTTEYFQHFDRNSILRLERSVLIVVGPTFANAEFSWLIIAGFRIQRIGYGEILKTAGIQATFVPSDPETPRWDCKVSSLMIGFEVKSIIKWCYFQSDTAPLKLLQEYIPKHWQTKPDIVVVTCHLKEFDAPGYSSWDNIIAPLAKTSDPRIALGLAAKIMPVDIYPLNISRRYIISGGDYKKKGRRLPKPHRDNGNLVDVIRALLVNSEIFHAKAGLKLDLEGDAREGSNTELTDSVDPVVEPFEVIEPYPDWDDARDRPHLEMSLRRLSTSLLLSELGRLLLFQDEYLGQNMDSRRFALQLIHSIGTENYKFCFAEGKFLSCQSSIDELLDLPAGLVIARSALVDIQRGVASAAEACSYNAIHWTIGTVVNSPLGLLYSTFP